MTRVSEAEITRAQKAEREAVHLQRSVRKRLEFLDFDWLEFLVLTLVHMRSILSTIL